MTPLQSFLLAIGGGLAVYTAVAYTVFVIRYHRLKWWETPEGRHLMGHSWALALTLWATILLGVLNVPAGLALALQVFLFGWLAFEATRRNRLLTRNQREAALERDPDPISRLPLTNRPGDDPPSGDRMLDIISRSEWGARYRDGFRERPVPFSEFWLHHSATIAPNLVAPFDDDHKAVRVLEDIGQARFGGGISYNQPVTPAGLVFVGVSPGRQGAHTKGHNTAGFAFVLVGSHTTKPPTAEQEEAIARRMVELQRQGKATRHTLNGGHRDASGNSTDCPGDAAHARIPAINRRAEELWAGGYGKVGTGGASAPPAQPAPLPSPSKPGVLAVDGKLGPATVKRWQKVMGTEQDGEISRPSELVRAVQRRLNSKGARLVVDGKGIQTNNRDDYGPTNTVRALQRYLGTHVDGILSHPTSNAVKALQRKLNEGTF